MSLPSAMKTFACGHRHRDATTITPPLVITTLDYRDVKWSDLIHGRCKRLVSKLFFLDTTIASLEDADAIEASIKTEREANSR